MLDTSELLDLAPCTETLADQSESGSLCDSMLAGITDLKVWDNYTDDELYELDKAVRKWIKQTDVKKIYKGKIRTTAQLVFLWIFGRQPDQYKDTRIIKKLNTLLRYYSQKEIHQTKLDHRNARNVYEFGMNGGHKMAYSIRLRLEMHASGEKVVSDKVLFSYGLDGINK